MDGPRLESLECRFHLVHKNKLWVESHKKKKKSDMEEKKKKKKERAELKGK